MDESSQRPTKPFDIRERTLEFADDILDLSAGIPSTEQGRVVRSQLADAGTSVGANVEEADWALSKPERRRILGIVRREAGESRYWLRLAKRRWSDRLDLDPYIQATTEIIKSLSAKIEKLS